MAKVLFPKYLGGVESKENRVFDEELLAICGVEWGVEEGPPMSRAHDFVECGLVTQEELEAAVRQYDHVQARINFEARHPKPRDLAAEITDLRTRLEKLEKPPGA